MSLFNRALRPSPTLSDQAIEGYLAALPGELEPDPLFRRRLRSEAVNQFVAVREGIASPDGSVVGRRQLGKVGRACLYASFTLGVSAASVMAASQEALPGDLLYPLKRHIEELRWDVVPAQLHEELAAYALGERVEEMARLADAGHLDLAIAMAPAIDRERDRLVTLGQAHDDARTDRIERHLLVLQGLLEKLPATARAAIEGVTEGTPTIGQGTESAPTPANGGGVIPAAGGSAGGETEPRATSTPDPTPRPEQTPKPDPTQGPDATPKPERSPMVSLPTVPMASEPSD
jgi:hypothetical protein